MKKINIVVTGFGKVKCVPDREGQKKGGKLQWIGPGKGKWAVILPDKGPFDPKYVGDLLHVPGQSATDTTTITPSAVPKSEWKYSVVVQLEGAVLADDPEIVIDPGP